MPYLGNVPSSFNVGTDNINNDAITTAKIADGAILNADVNAAAAIAGTKISPDFGSQNILTTGTTTAASLIPTSSTAPTNGLYLPAANSVAISTGGSGRLFVDANGNVGVGTSSISTFGGYTTLEINNGTNGAILDLSQADVMRARFVAVSSSATIETSGSIPFLLSPGGTEKLRVTSAGLVGIGTSSPSSLLHVTGGSGQLVEFGTGNSLRIGGFGTGNCYVKGNETTVSFGNVNAGNTVFLTGDTERVRIDSSGRVGIGTTSPSLPFHLYNASAALAYFESTSASGPYVIWRSSGTSIGDVGSALGVSGVGSATDFMVASRSGPLLLGSGSQERCRLDTSGRLLIGTSSDISGGETNRVIQGAASTGAFIALSRTDATITNNEVLAGVEFRGNGNPSASIYAWADADHGTNDYPGRLVFSTTADGASSPTERMRIHNGGCVSVANGLVIGSLGAVTNSLNISGSVIASGAGNSTLKWNTSSGTVTYDTSSRLVKNQIVNCPYGISEIKKLQPRKYFRTDDQREEIGFIADEMVQVMPEFVPIGPKSVITKNEEDTEQIPIGVNYEKLTAVLTAALQEAIGEIEKLKARVVALESKP